MPSTYLDALCGKGVQPSHPLLQGKDANNQKAHDGSPENAMVLSSNTTVNASGTANVEYMLINTGYGAFRFSDEFKQQVSLRGFVGDLSRTGRFHPVSIALFDAKGSEWSSGSFACIKKVAFPAGFQKFVTIVNDKGGESIVVDFHMAFSTGTQELLNEPNASMEDVRALKAKIDAAKNVWESCRVGVDTTRPEPSDKVVVKDDDKVKKAKPVFEYILINACYGGFGFSNEFKQAMKSSGFKGSIGRWYRGHPKVIALFDEMGWAWSSGSYGSLKKVAVPAGYVKYAHVHEYDGLETLQYIEFSQAFTQGVEKIMAKDDPGTMADEIIALKSDIDAAKEVWEQCQRFNNEDSDGEDG